MSLNSDAIRDHNADEQTWPNPRRFRIIGLLALCLIMVGYVANLRRNPPGFYIDESSISYNAYTIAQTGRDEFGVRFPLLFRAFGEYKNPVYIYLLALVFRITGPSILVARLLSVTLVIAACFLIALLAKRLSGCRTIAFLILLSALLTPWLFELSRVVLEVAIYPLAIALVLVNLQRATNKSGWPWFDATTIALSLALLTYAYSIGRLMGPLLAVGLLFFLSRVRWTSIARVWAVYALLLLPMLVFHWRHPGALMSRFHFVSFVTAGSSYPQIVWVFLKHLAANFNFWRLVESGDPNSHQIVAIYGLGQILVATFALSLLGLYLVVRYHLRDPWWRFVLYGLVMSAVPASLTKENFHILRLAAMPVFILVLCVPALDWLINHRATRGWRLALMAVVLLTLGQGALFQWQYNTYGRSPFRQHLFDADYQSRILSVARSQPLRPIYLADAEPIPGYIQAYWYSTLSHLPLSDLKRLPPDMVVPAGAIAITTEDVRPRCQTRAEMEPYTICFMQGEPQQPTAITDMRAELHLGHVATQMSTGQPSTVQLVVKNTSNSSWFARERGAAPLQVNVGNHWLDPNGRQIIHDDGRGPLPRNLLPGQETQVEFTVNAPSVAGQYLLEFDVVQEGVSWFALKGSPPLRVPIKVK